MSIQIELIYMFNPFSSVLLIDAIHKVLSVRITLGDTIVIRIPHGPEAIVDHRKNGFGQTLRN